MKEPYIRHRMKRARALLSGQKALLHWRWVLVLVGLSGVLAAARWSWVPPRVSGRDCALTHNAAWISVDWTSQPVDERAVEQLAARALEREIRYVFPFTTYIKPNGSFNPTFAHATGFVQTFQEYNQEALLLAWIGVPLHSERRFAMKGWVDLSDEETRRRIAALARQLTVDAGFDGIHLDVEHVDNKDRDYLLLLDEVKRAIGSQHVLSVAGNDWVPGVVNLLPWIGNYKWGSGYVRAVGDRVDQIAVMTYDSFMPHAALYRLWLREQVKGLNKSLADSDTQLLVGLSISREKSATHYPRAENMESGLAGICAGVSALPQERRKMEGVAIYAAWEATPDDWRAWTDWVAGPSVKRH